MAQDHPDAQVYPHATGAAEQMVKAHQEEAPLKLYSGWFCPFVQRVLLVLLEKQIDFQYIEVNPYHKPASLMSLNPRGLVPTLEYDNKPLYESTVICEFLEDAYPSSSPQLLPSDPYTKARVPSVQPASPTDSGLEKVRQDFLKQITEFTDAMDPKGPFFLGEEISMVDLIIAPWAVRLWVFDHFKAGLGKMDDAVGERWGRFLKAIEGRQSVICTTSEREHYLPIYQRYADDIAQSELAKSTREGKGVP